MKKEFNVTGNCFAEDHYMMDNSRQLREVMALVDSGKYFTLNRPRQFGKTTTINTISEQLRSAEKYLPIELNFQGVDSQWYESDEAFVIRFFQHLIDFFEYRDKNVYQFLISKSDEIIEMRTLSKLVTDLILKLDKKVVLLIDEVDASSNYLPFLSFLAMLRTKYLARKKPYQATFHSVVLVGVHDIKSLKYKLRNPEEAQYNSPWNIATDFEVEMAFYPKEIEPMLEEYGEAEGVAIDVPTIAERLYHYTSGYPFLVSKLCKNIVDKILKTKENPKVWTLEDVEASVQLMVREDNTNFDSLIKNLENNEELYDLVYDILVDGAIVPFNPHDPITSIGRMYGVFKRNGRLKIHNRIYEQIIYNYMASKTLRKYLSSNRERFGDSTYVDDDYTLDFERVLKKFQAFMKAQRSEKDTSFIERQWRLIFLAFLEPIINGKGHSFKEVEVSEEKRLDIVVTHHHYKYILELKLWRGEKKHQESLDQLTDYLSIHSVQKGYLLIFDSRKTKGWEAKWVVHKGKEIFAVWV
ncbi:MAG: AAA-like domain-containing protein [Bacteroidota bacterium]